MPLISILLVFFYLLRRAFYFLQLGPVLTTVTYLAASILVDLELDKPCLQDEFNKHPGKQMLPKWSAKFSIPESRTMEHRRLAMAAYSFSARYFPYRITNGRTLANLNKLRLLPPQNRICPLVNIP